MTAALTPYLGLPDTPRTRDLMERARAQVLSKYAYDYGDSLGELVVSPLEFNPRPVVNVQDYFAVGKTVSIQEDENQDSAASLYAAYERLRVATENLHRTVNWVEDPTELTECRFQVTAARKAWQVAWKEAWPMEAMALDLNPNGPLLCPDDATDGRVLTDVYPRVSVVGREGDYLAVVVETGEAQDYVAVRQRSLNPDLVGTRALAAFEVDQIIRWARRGDDKTARAWVANEYDVDDGGLTYLHAKLDRLWEEDPDCFVNDTTGGWWIRGTPPVRSVPVPGTEWKTVSSNLNDEDMEMEVDPMFATEFPDYGADEADPFGYDGSPTGDGP